MRTRLCFIFKCGVVCILMNKPLEQSKKFLERGEALMAEAYDGLTRRKNLLLVYGLARSVKGLIARDREEIMFGGHAPFNEFVPSYRLSMDNSRIRCSIYRRYCDEAHTETTLDIARLDASSMTAEGSIVTVVAGAYRGGGVFAVERSTVLRGGEYLPLVIGAVRRARQPL
jgi:hypothetical protein